MLATLAIYANSLGGAFVLDDTSNIAGSAVVGGPFSLAAFLAHPRPVLALSLWLNYQWGGASPTGYHVVNLAVHVVAGLTLYALVRLTLLRGRDDDRAVARDASLFAFAVAMLWLVHPLQTQAVTYIIQRAESMMAMFFLLSLLCAARAGFAERNRAAWLVGAVVCGWLSLGTKQVAVVLPAVMLLYDRTFVFRGFAEALRRRWWVYGLIAVAAVPAILQVGEVAAERDASAGFALAKHAPWQYVLTQPEVILHYLRLVAYPSPLVFDYDWPVVATIGEAFPAILVIAALLVLTGVALRRWPVAGFLLAMFFLVLAPTSLMPLADVAEEYRMYLPLAPVLTLAVWGVAVGLRRVAERNRRPVALAGLGVVALAWGVQTVARNFDYGSVERLWRDTVAKAPDNPRAYTSLGDALFQQRRVEEAAQAYARAVEIEPRHLGARARLAMALAHLDRIDAAAAVLRELPPGDEVSVGLREVFANSYAHLGHAYVRRGDTAGAIAAYSRSLELDPDETRVHNELGIVLAQSGRVAEAAERFEAAVKLDASFTDAAANLQRARAMLQAERREAE